MAEGINRLRKASEARKNVLLEEHKQRNSTTNRSDNMHDFETSREMVQMFKVLKETKTVCDGEDGSNSDFSRVPEAVYQALREDFDLLVQKRRG